MTTTWTPAPTHHLRIGAAVRVIGRGDGVITNHTHGSRPWHVSIEGMGVFKCNAVHLSEIEDADRRRQLEDDYANAKSKAWDTLVLGATVRLDDREGVWVVIGVPKNGRINVAPLGGNANRYVKATIANVTPVKVKVALA